MTTFSAAALTQQRLWGADPEAWAAFSEPHLRPLFLAALEAGHVDSGTRLLDVGCGSGLLLSLAQERGARVTGLDISPGMLGVAARVAPEATLEVGDLQQLPFAAGSFDVVTGINAFAFAEDPRVALVEAARVVRAEGRVVVGMFAEPERNESTVIHDAMQAVVPAADAGDHAPYALSAPGNLEAALMAAGLVVEGSGEVALDWHYARVADAVVGLSRSGGGALAVEAVGAEVIEAVIQEALVPFTDASTGEVVMHNVFRWVSAVKVER